MKDLIILIFCIGVGIMTINSDKFHQVQEFISTYDVSTPDTIEVEPSLTVNSPVVITTENVNPQPMTESVSTGLEKAPERVKAYISRFAPVAQEESKRYGIPASIKLAQGILESGWGESPLVQKANNHFGIKCFSKSCKKGHCVNREDDSHKDFFMAYKTEWESWRAHSILLTSKPVYEPLKRFNSKDYVGWATQLKKCGYATSPNYDRKLISIIEEYNLNQYDL